MKKMGVDFKRKEKWVLLIILIKVHSHAGLLHTLMAKAGKWSRYVILGYFLFLGIQLCVQSLERN